MNISSDTVMKKMADEVKKAQQSINEPQKFIQQIIKIKVLCDLLLDEGEFAETVKKDDPQQLMYDKRQTYTSLTDEKSEDDSTSIFDF